MIYDNEYILIADEALLESGFFEELDRWKAANQDSDKKEYKNSMVTDIEYERMKDCLDIIENTEDYSEYSKAFNRFCYFCHIVPRGVILIKYELKRSPKRDKNSLYVKYTYNTKRMELPEGTALYHMSKVGGITELKPFFRGKAAKGYKYDKPRIYLTIRKNMPKIMADYKAGEKMHMYLVKEPVKNVFVDPMLWGYTSGAVYVETNRPLKVEEITNKKKADEIKEKNDEALAEAVILEEVEGEIPFDIDHFSNFITESGLIIESIE